MARTSRLVALAGLCWLLAPPCTSADPVTVTSGVLVAARPLLPGSMASLQGTRGFSLEARVTTGEGRVDVITNCDPCVPGAPLSVAGVLSGAAFTGVATLDGQTFTDIAEVDSPASIYMEFFGNTILPPFQNSEVLVTLPFTMRGFFMMPFSTAALQGQGFATVLLTRQLFDEPPQWRGDRVTYDFGGQATVPEPATLVLVGSGLLAIVRRARRR